MPPPGPDSQEKTVTLEIQLPTSVADGLRARVSSGEFASESDVVAHLLRKAGRMQPPTPVNEEEWDNEVCETIARLDRGEEPTYTLEEMRQHFEQRRAERTAA